MRLVCLLTLLLAPIAFAAPALDPGVGGPLPVGVTTLTLTDAARARTLVTEVWYPAVSAGRDAELHHGRDALVLVAHGHCGSRTNYEFLTEHLASWGFVVAAPDIPMFCLSDGPLGDVVHDPARDYQFLDATFFSGEGETAPFRRILRRRAQRTGIVGHSLAGLSLVDAAETQVVFAAVLGLAPAVGATQGSSYAAAIVSRPRGRRPAVMAMGGTADTTVSFTGLTQPFFDPLPPPAFLLKIVGGTHSGFTDHDSLLSPAALARQQLLVRRYATAFLSRYVARRGRFGRFLTAVDATAQGADVELTARP